MHAISVLQALLHFSNVTCAVYHRYCHLLLSAIVLLIVQIRFISTIITVCINPRGSYQQGGVLYQLLLQFAMAHMYNDELL